MRRDIRRARWVARRAGTSGSLPASARVGNRAVADRGVRLIFPRGECIRPRPDSGVQSRFRPLTSDRRMPKVRRSKTSVWMSRFVSRNGSNAPKATSTRGLRREQTASAKNSWGRSSAGRASRSQREGRRFDPARLHHSHPERRTHPAFAVLRSGPDLAADIGSGETVTRDSDEPCGDHPLDLVAHRAAIARWTWWLTVRRSPAGPGGSPCGDRPLDLVAHRAAIWIAAARVPSRSDPSTIMWP
jgi:hypothetical protein